MTHIDNIPHILEYGITHKSSPLANNAYTPIGDTDVIRKRDIRNIRTTDGCSFVLGDFIPFYYYCRMPMLYNIQHGFNVPKVNPDDIVYLILKLSKIITDPNREYFFSDAHAIWRMTKFYSKRSISRIDEILDTDAIRNNSWGDDYLVREKKQAEFFIKGDIPAEHIEMMICYSESARTKLMNMEVKCDVRAIKEAYY